MPRYDVVVRVEKDYIISVEADDLEHAGIRANQKALDEIEKRDKLKDVSFRIISVRGG